MAAIEKLVGLLKASRFGDEGYPSSKSKLERVARKIERITEEDAYQLVCACLDNKHEPVSMLGWLVEDGEILYFSKERFFITIEHIVQWFRWLRRDNKSPEYIENFMQGIDSYRAELYSDDDYPTNGTEEEQEQFEDIMGLILPTRLHLVLILEGIDCKKAMSFSSLTKRALAATA